jgi:hypothetical protein
MFLSPFFLRRRAVTRKKFYRAVGVDPPPPVPVAAAPATLLPPPTVQPVQVSPDDVATSGKNYVANADYVPLLVFLSSLPPERCVELTDLRSEGLRVAAETVRLGFVVKKLPHARNGSVLCYPRVVLEKLYLREQNSE